MNRFFRIRLVYPQHAPNKTVCVWNFHNEKSCQRGLKKYIEHAKKLARYHTSTFICEEKIDGVWNPFSSWTSTVPNAAEIDEQDRLMKEELDDL